MEKLSVLVVDDEPGICSGISRILKNFTVSYPFMDDDIGFDVKEAYTGEEAIDAIDSNAPDILLLDNKLPGIHGIDVLEYINKKGHEILVMMITSYASLELAVKATNTGAYDFIPKPFTPQELRSSMENVSKRLFLKRMTKKLKQEGKQIRFQFLSVLSHELKAPINAVEGYLNIMKEKQAGDSLDDYQEIIDRSLTRINGMRNMIMDLLDLTKIESGKKSREVQPINLAQLAKSSIDTMGPYAIQKDVKINLDAADNITLMADNEEIEIIFNNLISNAIKYNKTGGEVHCHIKEKDHSVEISIEDTGIGMNEEEINVLFKEFVRIKNEKTKNITGSGLGLSIVKKIVDLYNGDIRVTSKPDKGSVFTLYIPK